MVYNGPNNDRDSCERRCMGYEYAGVQGGTQCWCGHEKPKYEGDDSNDPLLPPADCKLKCPANPNQECGGPSNKMNVFRIFNNRGSFCSNTILSPY